MARVLTEELFTAMKQRLTAGGVTVDKCIEPGVQDPSDPIGLVAGDAECYEEFAELFDAVLLELHGTTTHAQGDGGGVEGSTWAPWMEEYVTAASIGAARGLQQAVFGPSSTAEETMAAEEAMVVALQHAQLSGEYKSLSKQEEASLRRSHAPGGTGLSQGMWVDDARGAVVWFNQGDHLHISCAGPPKEPSHVLKSLLAQFRAVSQEVEAALGGQGIQLARSQRLGYLVTSPADVGTGLRATLCLKLSQVSQHEDLQQRCHKHGLKVAVQGDIVEILAQNRLGVSEGELITALADCGAELVSLEKDGAPEPDTGAVEAPVEAAVAEAPEVEAPPTEEKAQEAGEAGSSLEETPEEEVVESKVEDSGVAEPSKTHDMSGVAEPSTEEAAAPVEEEVAAANEEAIVEEVTDAPVTQEVADAPAVETPEEAVQG